MAITRVQGNARQTTTSSSISVTLSSAPVEDNLLIAVIGMRTAAGGEGVSSISQTGVTWTQQVYRQNSNGTGYVGIWAGVVGSGASTSVTVNLNQTADRGAVANICEYSGLRTSGFLDDKNTSYNGPVTQTDTGTVTTTENNELWIGGVETAWSSQTNPTNGFTLMDGQAYSQTAVAYLEKIVSSKGQANSGTTCTSTYYVGCIATFKSSDLEVHGNLTVDYELLLPGNVYTPKLTNGQILSRLWRYDAQGEWDPYDFETGTNYQRFQGYYYVGDQLYSHDLNLFTILSVDNNYAPLLVTDEGFIVKKDIAAGGFISSQQGELWLGHGRDNQTDVPKINLIHSGDGYDTLYLRKADATTPAHLNLGNLTANGTVQAAGYKASDGTNGATADVVISGTTLHFKNGLFVGSS